jgi:hypothetical protein
LRPGLCSYGSGLLRSRRSGVLRSGSFGVLRSGLQQRLRRQAQPAGLVQEVLPS